MSFELLEQGIAVILQGVRGRETLSQRLKFFEDASCSG